MKGHPVVIATLKTWQPPPARNVTTATIQMVMEAVAGRIDD
jgi:hypothetical protein